ncbi:hypothetical protein JD844_015068 [Phrynosoma platyrhinos]|uniref:OBG-type G domain-containing protein n=1 Tax=Phrynosoma platyrhinos TaxID=52577 RepID=A0ABQ7T7K4_PHRPL|nr:hypothetical protein JD844_015068 [Phrynosoma platyrhinos]
MARTQKNKATAHHLGLLKARLAKLRRELITPKGGGGGGPGEGFDVAKTGDARIGFVGFPSVGKSTLLSNLAGVYSEVAAYEFTTLTTVPGVIRYKGAKIQPLGHKKIIENELEGFGIRLNSKPPNIGFKKKDKGGINLTATCSPVDDGVYIPCIYVLNKIDQISIEELDIIYKVPHCVPISAHHRWNFDDLLEKIWDYLKLVRIALVWGASVKHNPQKVGKDHTLEDEDVIQIVKK